MCKYSTEFRDDNYLWDSDNQCLVKYNQSTPTVVKGNTNPERVNTVFPIPISEDLLTKVFNGVSDGAAGYELDEKQQVVFCGNAPYGVPFKFYDKPVRYLNDLQNICADNQSPLPIDEDQLYDFCLRKK